MEFFARQIIGRLRVSTSRLGVIRAAWQSLHPEVRKSKLADIREQRRDFYRLCLEVHVENQNIYRAVMAGRLVDWNQNIYRAVMTGRF